MNILAQRHCAPYGGEAAVASTELIGLHRWVPDWHVLTCEGISTLERDFAFANFAEALAFTDRIGALAKAELHFPEIKTQWGKVRVCWWTPALKGLHRNDFIMAAKTDALYAETASKSGQAPTPIAAGEAKREAPGDTTTRA
jgi:4a-hydroxytetrahydrobiopterin dehydratase